MSTYPRNLFRNHDRDYSATKMPKLMLDLGLMSLIDVVSRVKATAIQTVKGDTVVLYHNHQYKVTITDMTASKRGEQVFVETYIGDDLFKSARDYR